MFKLRNPFTAEGRHIAEGEGDSYLNYEIPANPANPANPAYPCFYHGLVQSEENR